MHKETIKFNKVGTVLVIIAIVIIIMIAISTFNREFGMKRESTFAYLRKRWLELQNQVKEELEQLRLTREMELFLEQRISRAFIFAKGLFVFIFLITFFLFFQSGQDIITSVLSSAAILGFTFYAMSFIVISKFTDCNEMIRAVREYIKNYIYKKYGYDPSAVQVLQESIASKNNELNQLEARMNAMPTNFYGK